MVGIRSHFAASHGDRAVSGLYQGCFDMTYFALFPPALKSRGLKLAIVLDYESFAFEVWLAARNRALQRRYCSCFGRTDGPSTASSSPPRESTPSWSVTSDACDLQTPEVLTSRMEASAQAVLDDVVGFLSVHDPLEAV